ncbi:GNAT family N-acetyltransferase/peptidase C39 family protein [Methylomonas albis]|uniref:GNAT family N-acetyltransferase/peptidase C39 family protein n=1 Tax=Methylomonas albis TaxID=1854563 RepID=A0ABR9D005_9GAMM|nr:GNAT family N-acetyltransferase/peptidase C39 family protein [Methylomonas albis]MBD9356459.1 GNAT family N-acetyltransferase/peptidase C39 family protein [Methylomonas albis]
MTALPALAHELAVRPAQSADLEGLVALENASFATDKLSRRSFRHWLSSEHRALLVAEWAGLVAGYILIIYHPGTRLARIYSLAVSPQLRGYGIAKSLMLAGEQAARDDGRLYLRLEVSVDNTPAIRLYEALGFQKFGMYRDYYQDHKDALRYQKRIRRYRDTPQHRSVHWLRQTTPFTCGPAALMMAMHALNKSYLPSREQEIELWREATTIFMTSGHGGCHPIGLALAAKRRQFAVEVWINQTGSLFIDGVRSEDKKQIVELVDTCFKREAVEQGVAIHYTNVTQNDLIAAFEAGAIPLILISTYSMDRKKVPHWVVMSGFDKDCLYMHDSDPDDGRQNELDCQFIPIAREDFERMSCFGKSRLRTAVIVWPGI